LVEPVGWSEFSGKEALMAGAGYYSDRTFGTGHDDKLIDGQPPKDCVVRSRSPASLAPTGSEVTLDEIYRILSGDSPSSR
jgi:hypothetical protein